MFTAKDEGSLRAACQQLDGEDIEKAEPGLPRMPAGRRSSASDAGFSEYSNISVHFICSNHSLPLLSTLCLSEALRFFV